MYACSFYISPCVVSYLEVVILFRSKNIGSFGTAVKGQELRAVVQGTGSEISW